ncbi:uncharacterized protein B0I36DRAFT_347991 [Microdochium trichocladiopsis]|uniref:Uncharacterized protein n=1 Tax=Microdochium trichocladiopsis TaxID=1682393 RepID=A0A9P9BV07_9PEZI|nr:uncharacterized protein B0I36DRAFT_347991 [Microdochium trichocladiopsis]KAH7032832.1 hypothetical protein B0I36DRAFT_347991 [Microdochium trichocladiopsis]
MYLALVEGAGRLARGEGDNRLALDWSPVCIRAAHHPPAIQAGAGNTARHLGALDKPGLGRPDADGKHHLVVKCPAAKSTEPSRPSSLGWLTKSFESGRMGVMDLEGTESPIVEHSITRSDVLRRGRSAFGMHQDELGERKRSGERNRSEEETRPVISLFSACGARLLFAVERKGSNTSRE